MVASSDLDVLPLAICVIGVLLPLALGISITESCPNHPVQDGIPTHHLPFSFLLYSPSHVTTGKLCAYICPTHCISALKCKFQEGKDFCFFCFSLYPQWLRQCLTHHRQSGNVWWMQVPSLGDFWLVTCSLFHKHPFMVRDASRLGGLYIYGSEQLQDWKFKVFSPQSEEEKPT